MSATALNRSDSVEGLFPGQFIGVGNDLRIERATVTRLVGHYFAAVRALISSSAWTIISHVMRSFYDLCIPIGKAAALRLSLHRRMDESAPVD